MPYLVGAKGQIVIAKEIRERLEVKPGWVALQRLVEDRVEIYFLPPEHRESLKGSLAQYWALPHRMDTKLRSTYNQLGGSHECKAEKVQQAVQIGFDPDVRERRKSDGPGGA